ncbi:hypothetical protein BT69DRAFT_1276875, partial [Atractiella rhizophila]
MTVVTASPQDGRLNNELMNDEAYVGSNLQLERHLLLVVVTRNVSHGLLSLFPLSEQY